jgi:toxin ParE1/3/4
MAKYTLELEAENDLFEIGRYTARTWGLEQTEIYLGQLERHFEGLCADQIHARTVFEHRADILYSHCQHHYVFFFKDREANVIILAVLHENMDLLARLQERLG